MAISRGQWRKLSIPLSELCISTVLRCGQSFRWKFSAPDEWSCALKGRIITLRQDATHLHYLSTPPSALDDINGDDDDDNDDDDGTAQLLHDYFNLNISLPTLYSAWSARDPHFKRTAPSFSGVRILRQDPWENVCSFICSSNNNIARISQMVQNLCRTWGEPLGGGGDGDGDEYYDFPRAEKLVGEGVEARLRELGFGYRARYIAATARMVVREKGGEEWLRGLREVGYREAHDALLELPGVGPKVADCVCLMSLDKAEAVPVDTHVLQIAQRNYGFGKTRNKTLTKATYEAIGDHFRALWGKEAGWAHSVLFTADLRAFSERLQVKSETESVSLTGKMVVKKEEAAMMGGEGEGGIKAEAAGVVAEKKRKRVKVEVKQEMKEEAEVEWEEPAGVTVSLAERVKRRRRR